MTKSPKPNELWKDNNGHLWALQSNQGYDDCLLQGKDLTDPKHPFRSFDSDGHAPYAYPDCILKTRILSDKEFEFNQNLSYNTNVLFKF